MDGSYNIPDSTDWLQTPLKDFATLENALHCEICKEFYETPMITSCSHTFCSKCIRTALSTDGRCPSCRVQDQASKLRNNWVLQQVVDAFVNARPAALNLAVKEQEQEQGDSSRRPGKRKRAVLDSDDIAQAEQDKRTTRSKTRRLAASQTSERETIEVLDSDDEGDDESAPGSQPGDGLVECPLGCGKRMKIEAVEPHLDKCEEEKMQATIPKSRTPVNSVGNSRPPPTQNAKPQDRISELNYSLLTDTKLRTKLKELGIPNYGTKQLMIKRHTEWVNLWNANCDSQRPRSERELLRELDTWERTQGGRAPTANGLSTSVMRKDFDGSGWANKNKDDFSRLIAEAKRKKMNPALEQQLPKAIDQAERISGTLEVMDTEDSSPLPPNTSQSTPPPAEPSAPTRPYENNPEAIASIRQKVEAANAGQHIEPVMNAGFDHVPTDAIPMPPIGTDFGGETMTDPPAVAENAALLEKSHFGLSRDEHVAREIKARSPSDIPAHLQSSPVKVPMFAVPQRPFSDVDGGGGGGSVER